MTRSKHRPLRANETASVWTWGWALWLVVILPALAVGFVGYHAATPVTRVGGQNLLNVDTASVPVNTVAGDASFSSEWSVTASSPRNPDRILIAVNRDLRVSNNRGATWQVMPGVLPGTLDTLAISPANDNLLYAGVDGLGFYASKDGGQTWVPMNTGIGVAPGTRFGVTAIAVDSQNPNRIFVAAGVWLGTATVSFHPLGLLMTLNGGRTWEKVPTRDAEHITQLRLNQGVVDAWNGVRWLHYPAPGAVD